MKTFDSMEDAIAAGLQRAEAGLVENYRGGEISLRHETPPPRFGATIVVRATRGPHQSPALLYSCAIRIGGEFIAALETEALESALREGRVWIDAEIESGPSERDSEGEAVQRRRQVRQVQSLRV